MISDIFNIMSTYQKEAIDILDTFCQYMYSNYVDKMTGKRDRYYNGVNDIFIYHNVSISEDKDTLSEWLNTTKSILSLVEDILDKWPVLEVKDLYIDIVGLYVKELEDLHPSQV